MLSRVSVTCPAPRHAWNDILANDDNALPDQTPAWLDTICAAGGHEEASRLYVFLDGRRFVLPLVRRGGPTGAGGWLSSYPPAWGIGGVLGAGIDRDVTATVLADLRRVAAARIWIRPDPLQAPLWSPSIAPSFTTRAIARRAHVLDLTGDLDRALARMSDSTRQHIRQARRRVTRVETDCTGRLLPMHYELYLTSVQRWAQRQHEPRLLAIWRAKQRDDLHKLQTMARHLGEAMVVQVAFVGDRPAASNITLLGRTAHDIRAAIDISVASWSRAATILQWTAIQLAHAHGCTRLHLGESGDSTGVSTFKERFGATAIPYTEFRIERLPYTLVGRALRSGVKRLLGVNDM
ncbi:GNAT family N-acetyltransferase [Pseudonocardia adelaidensis]|uniref:GNAT family N-acetyltransferase n=1 Tax=Pseudonocardia adelaidensis TaxID=648754 RepID=UPI0031E806D9